MSSSQKKKHSSTPSTSAPASVFASPLEFQLPAYSKPQSQAPQTKQQSQPVFPWSAHAPSGQSSSLFFRNFDAFSKSATAAGELFLFGDYVQGPLGPEYLSNDLYVFSTQDFSTTLLRTSGDVPSPRYGPSAVFTSTSLMIWGGRTDINDWSAQDPFDNSLYVLNLVSREWTRIVVNGPEPDRRYHHTMELVGSKLFVFGGCPPRGVELNPFWESYEPAPGNEKPFPRTGHVSVTTGDRIVIFGGCGRQYFNDTWSFSISTRKWNEVQCTGSIPSPRTSHAAVLIDDVMYVHGGRSDGRDGRTNFGELTAFNLSTQRWTAFQDIGPNPGERWAHAMASDGRRVFVLGGALSPGAQMDEAKPIHVLDTRLLIYPSASPQVTREPNPSLNGLSSRPTGTSGRQRRIPEEEDDSEGSREHHAELVAPGAPSAKEIARLEHERLVELELRLSETVVAKTERDRRIAQLTDELALKSSLLEQAVEEKERAGLELRELKAKLDESLLSRDHALEQAQSSNAQVQSALQKASRAAEANEQSQRELTEMRAELGAKRSELAAFHLHTENETKVEADTFGTHAGTSLGNLDEDRVVDRLMERMQTMEAEIASLRWNEKSFERMECHNEG